MKFYFGGAIRGGREKVEDYARIVDKLKEYGEVLTVHVASKDLTSNGEQSLNNKDIYERDIAWLTAADLVVAEVTVPSLGIGYELAYAEKLGKKVVCYFDKTAGRSLSAMISGNSNFEIIEYNNIDEILADLDIRLSK